MSAMMAAPPPAGLAARPPSQLEEHIDMDLQIRPIAPEETEAFIGAIERAFGGHPRPEEIDGWRSVMEYDRTLAVFDGPRIVGNAGVYTIALTVPGGRISMPGVTWVGVAPTHRRRGILTMMMRRQLDDFRERGEPVAGLWASEGTIYQRFGYGLSALGAELEIARAKTAFARQVSWPGSVRLEEDKQAALAIFKPIHEAVAAGRPGMWSRTPQLWDENYQDLEHWRDGFSAHHYAVYEGPDGPEGYVAYRFKHDWAGGMPHSTLKVLEHMATTFDAYAALWRFVFDHDLVGTITAFGRAPDEPLLHMLAEPRALRLRVGDALWLRIVDVPAALSARRYSADGRVVLEVRDSFCAWNDGRFELEAAGDDVRCERTSAEPDLVVDAQDLAAAYLGGTGFRWLHRAGRVVEAVPGGLARADALFTWDPPPWCPNVF
jgi:predicted acetyltransferase